MATLGVVSYSVGAHNKMQILQQSTASNTMNHGAERREIIILRKKPRPPPPPAAAETKAQPPPPAPPQAQPPPPPQLPGLAQPAPASAAASGLPLAPALLPNGGGGGGGRARKRPPGSLLARSHQPPPNAVARRNARERNRVKQVNNGFATLREHIPVAIAAAYSSGAGGGDAAARGGGGGGASKKLSKVETLRMAVDYIRSLQRLLEMDENDPNTSNSSLDSNGFSSPTGHGDGHQPGQGYYDGKHGDSPGVVLLDEDDDGSLIDPSSPDVTTPSHSYHSSMASSAVDLQRKAYADAPLYEVDENLAPVIVSPSSAHAGDARTLSPAVLGVAPHLVGGGAGDLYGSPAELALLQRAPLPAPPPPLPPPPTTASLSPGVYSEQSASPVGAEGGGGGAADEAAHGVFLPAFTGALKATLGTVSAGACPPGLAAYAPAHAYHHAALPLKRESSPAHHAAPPHAHAHAHDMMDIMAWWEHDDRLRHVPSSS